MPLVELDKGRQRIKLTGRDAHGNGRGVPTSGIIECWGYRFQSPTYESVDPGTGEAVYLAAATAEERRDPWRRIARSRVAQLDWHASDELTDSQLERILAILDERR